MGTNAKSNANEAVRQVVTDRIVAMLEAGVVPWRKPWRAGGAPRNYVSGKEYRGANAIILGCCAAYGDPRYLSFKQAKDLGGSVRKGEKGWPIIFFKRMTDRRDAHLPEDKRRGFALLRYSTTFNVTQCDGLQLPALPEVERQLAPIPACQAVVNGYVGALGGPALRTGGARACYAPATDQVTVPALGAFDAAAEYYSTLFHEFGHSTGAAKRLSRKGVTDPVNFGSHAYSEEELVAEMTACFLCGETGIEAETIENSAAYVGGWLKRLRGDSTLVLAAAGQAQRAADHVLGRDARASEDEVAA